MEITFLKILIMSLITNASSGQTDQVIEKFELECFHQWEEQT